MDNFLIQDFRFIAVSIATGALVVLTIFWFLDRSPFSSWFKKSEGIVASFISVPAFLFGLVISTFATGVWNNHVAANSSLINEATAIRTLVRISQTLQTQDGQELTSATNNYVTFIVDTEWPSMANGNRESNEDSLIQLEILTNKINGIANTLNQSSSVVHRLYSSIDSLHHERLVRLSLAYDRISFVRWPSIYALAFLLLFTVGLLQLRSPRAMKITLTMGALCIGSSMIFLFLNTSPYHGPTSIKPTLLIDSTKLSK
ncbi:MAG: hypothetical protein ACOYBT_07820 [Polynucleobacter sp.]